MHPLENIIRENKLNHKNGIYSCCSANAYVLRAAIERARETNSFALIEATANQVDQYGGYTGMTPADFSAYAKNLADECGLPQEKLILGGDHLGPLTFSDLPEKEAMEKAEELVRCYVLAGFTKIHLDTSMKLASDSQSQPLSVETVAARGARLCAVCEKAYAKLKMSSSKATKPVYIIGSEVPIPGGAQEKEEFISVTKETDARETICCYKRCFVQQGLADVLDRVIGLVVQPGVEFGDDSIFEYNSAAAGKLCTMMQGNESMTFEAHSTDYQTKYGLRQMVMDGFAILKVGPALTFALREALFSLSMIEKEMAETSGFTPSAFREVLREEMLTNDRQWKKHYFGSTNEVEFKLKYSFSDRARYYLPEDKVNEAMKNMLENLEKHEIPLALLSQYMPIQYVKVRENELKNKPEELITDRIKNCIDEYLFATGVL